MQHVQHMQQPNDEMHDWNVDCGMWKIHDYNFRKKTCGMTGERWNRMK